MKHFGDIAYSPIEVKAEQAARGSRELYEGMVARPAPEGFGEREAAFIAMRDSFYMATVSENGWPYIQHRGGPRGFLKLLSPTQLGFADYRGNRQYVSVGNLKTEKRVSLFLMDYPNRARLKLLGRQRVRKTRPTIRRWLSSSRLRAKATSSVCSRLMSRRLTGTVHNSSRPALRRTNSPPV